MNIGIIVPFVGVENAETEFIARFEQACSANGHTALVIDAWGNVLKPKGGGLGKPGHISGYPDVAFCLSLHFNTPKLLDIHTFLANWNPPPYFHADHEYDALANLLTYDDYLSYGSRGLEAFLRRALRARGFTPSTGSPFYPSVPRSAVLQPFLPDKPRIFYVGINWERLSDAKGRHHTLLSLLDGQDMLAIYGPREIHDVRPWEGFQSYVGPLPFDGVSILKAINACGVALVLSSADHLRHEVVSSRLYECAAAGAVPICDRNPFLLEQFGDCVLTIDTQDTAEHAADQIAKHYVWIRNNREAALELARKCQQRFLEAYTLDHSITWLVAEYEQRRSIAEAQILDMESGTGVDILVPVVHPNEELLERIFKALASQRGVRIRPVLCVSARWVDIVERCIQKFNYLFPSAVAVSPPNNALHGVSGSLLRAALDRIENDFFLYFDGDVTMSSDHVSALARRLRSDPEALVAHSAMTERLPRGRYRLRGFGENVSSLLFGEFPSLSQSCFLMRRELLDGVDRDIVQDFEQWTIWPLLIEAALRAPLIFSFRNSVVREISSEVLHREDCWKIEELYRFDPRWTAVRQRPTVEVVSSARTRQEEVMCFDRTLKEYVVYLLESRPRLLKFLKRIHKNLRLPKS